MTQELGGTTQVSVRVANTWVKELDELAVQMSRPGIELARADILRAAIARGIQELKTEVEIAEGMKKRTKS